MSELGKFDITGLTMLVCGVIGYIDLFPVITFCIPVILKVYAVISFDILLLSTPSLNRTATNFTPDHTDLYIPAPILTGQIQVQAPEHACSHVSTPSLKFSFTYRRQDKRAPIIRAPCVALN